ncbi:hypothetical protein ACGFIX_12580 [Nocardia salmonicida]|uniref:hypothetical protein n=1 Tax=Nocardia salmonicida TaxID=53431 RepID=UPI00371C616E
MSSRTRAASREAPVGLLARGCRITARCGAVEGASEFRRPETGFVERNGHRARAEAGEQIEERRETRILDDHRIAETDMCGEQPVHGIEGAVEDGQPFARPWPVRAQRVGESGQHRLAEIVGRQIARRGIARERVQGGGEVGQ